MGRSVSLPWIVLTRRKPRLLFRFDGEFLLRFAERQFSDELFQLPPRFTRFDPPAGPRLRQPKVDNCPLLSSFYVLIAGRIPRKSASAQAARTRATFASSLIAPASNSFSRRPTWRTIL